LGVRRHGGDAKPEGGDATVRPECGCDVIIHGITVERPLVDLVLLLFFIAAMLVIGRTNKKSKERS
jgi:hypothetical protein